MTSILLNLEPYFEHKKTDLVSELEEFSEILFIDKGKILVGFTINNERKYCIQFKDKCIIGAYGMTWNLRS